MVIRVSVIRYLVNRLVKIFILSSVLCEKRRTHKSSKQRLMAIASHRAMTGQSIIYLFLFLLLLFWNLY